MPPPLPDRPERAKRQPQRVVDSVAGRIQGGLLKPGERVPSEPELMRELGVSRSVVREAMSRLQAGGMVETRQGVGTFVLAPPAARPLLGVAGQDLQLRQVFSMLELRVSVESDAASLAASRRSDAHLAAMREALDAFDAHRRAGAGTAEDDFRFHALIAAATGNEYFEEVMGCLGGATIRCHGSAAQVALGAGPAGGPRFGEPRTSLEAGKAVAQAEHEAIYEAIHRGDPAAARAAMFMHLNNSRERLRRLAE
ncbi:FadR/GntR family transcriptional regulator [Aquincola sp. MAHUQ-54]|uniref:FadR/GntR family transcriptional regulator n=1 Tax=Aquincola agrisoli TaxID=3119538 RepID=A0AAW9Q3L8_9BURK